MPLYRCVGQDVQILEDGQITHIPLPGPLSTPPQARLSQDGRYIFLGNGRGRPSAHEEKPAGVHGLWLYDRSLSQLIAIPHKVKEDDIYWDAVFLPDGTLLFSDGNTFWRWRPGMARTEKLFRFQPYKGAPVGLDISPDGRYLSYYKYRSDNPMFHLYEAATGEIRDLKFSIFHYGWLDSTHAAWTKSAGLKVLDTETGRSKTILRDYKAILKRGGSDAAVLDPFLKEEPLFDDLHFLGVQDGRIWFTLDIFAHHDRPHGSLPAAPSLLRGQPLRHTGIWSVNPDGSQPKLHYELPQTAANVHELLLLPGGTVGWSAYPKQGGLLTCAYNGTTSQSFPGWNLLAPAHC